MKESEIQTDIIRYLETHDFLVVKLIQTNKNGWPDLQAHKNGYTLFIEVKRPLGILSDLQKYRHRKLEKQGFTVITTSSLNDFKNELSTRCTALYQKWFISNIN